jgi:hypothetical protein
MFGIGRIDFEGFAESEHELIDASGLHLTAEVPNLCQEFLSADDPTFVLYEIPQER